MKSELVLPRQLLRWLMSEGGLQPDGRGYEIALQSPEGRAQVEALTPRQHREIRAQMVGLLAGPAAERIFRLEYLSLGERYEPGDTAKAEALAWLLPGTDELGHAARLAEITLRRPEVWSRVEALAHALEDVGDIGDGIRGFLPAAEANWPPGPQVFAG